MADTYSVEIYHRGSTYQLTVPADRAILDVALSEGLDLPYSCNAGVCTTCAAQIVEGTVDQSDAMGLSPDLQQQGFVLLCSAYPRSDLKLETDKEEAVYDLQFGQFQT